MKIYYYNYWGGLDEIKILSFNSQDLALEISKTCGFSITSLNQPAFGVFVSFKELSEKERKEALGATETIFLGFG